MAVSPLPMVSLPRDDFAIIIKSPVRLLMRKSKPLTAETLAELGADRLGALLLDADDHDAALARGLRIAVAARDDADPAGAAIDAEIKRLKRGTSPIDYKRMPAFAGDLSALCTAMEGPLADADPVMALARMFSFIDLALALIERSDDSEGISATPSGAACEIP